MIIMALGAYFLNRKVPGPSGLYPNCGLYGLYLGLRKGLLYYNCGLYVWAMMALEALGMATWEFLQIGGVKFWAPSVAHLMKARDFPNSQIGIWSWKASRGVC